jgi:deferrochelatase/peroxidase EfeB/predicted acylesterase/phospholipase RssA
MTAALSKEEVQRLALSGYDRHCSLHLVLEVRDAEKVRKLLGDLLDAKRVTFGDSDHVSNAINVGFTYRGLEALGLPERYRKQLLKKAPAFCEGAPARAARRLGDAGESAAECWEPTFRVGRAHVLISIHCDSEPEARAIEQNLASVAGARQAFGGWDNGLLAKHLTTDRKDRKVHFGFRDMIARPGVTGSSTQRHAAGELLLGYENDASFNRWGDTQTAERDAAFFRNGSFGVLRKIAQDEGGLNDFLAAQAAAHGVTRKFLKAKLCGRWPNGALVESWHTSEPLMPTGRRLDDFDFTKDPNGFGCPFGAHIRRTNPRGDPMGPSRKRPLFRRGMPYGLPYDEDPEAERGLIGLFFCASIEDQFEHVMLEWVEKKPIGPANRGDAKDPLIGHHDAPSVFQIPRPGGADIELTGFTPFVTTRGTLYAFFPSRAALRDIAHRWPQDVQAAGGTQRQAGASLRSSDGARQPDTAGTIESNTAPNDRFCDIVMEGGVTSGIIYSSAVAELAKHYRFKSIGGSSIGAFAAALTAAAEYRRRNGSFEGFKAIAEVPDKLAAEDGGKTRLLRMFRPQDSTRRLFEIFLATLGDKSMGSRFLSGLKEAICQYRRIVLAAAAVTAALVLAGPLLAIWRDLRGSEFSSLDVRLLGLASWGLALLLAVVFAAVSALVVGVVRDLRRGLIPNGFGLCRGWSGDQPYDSPDLDLTGYLHASIQLVAGRNPADPRPLTFKELWDAPGAATEVLGFASGEHGRRSINLEVYTTSLGHGRPYRFPLDPRDGMVRLFFREDEMERYFPKPIVNHLVAFGLPYTPQGRDDPAAISDAKQYIELPRDGHLPIAVAARLALSFPLLISAVPLYAMDYEARPKDRDLAECWFSDGGLCSNFPIHLFDSFMPKWPTFGISLQTRGKHRRNRPVWLPDRHYQGGADTWDRFADAKGLQRLYGFLLSLWNATWRWNDTTMMLMPGVRDRVVRVYLEEDEGGVNIKMPAKQIKDLAEKYGKAAAGAFRRKFVDDVGWSEHRWVRFNRLLIALRDQIKGFTFGANLDRYTTPMGAQIHASRYEAPLRGPKSEEARVASEKLLSHKQAQELTALLAALSALEAAFEQAGDHQPYNAVPRPSLRVRHPT